MSSKKKKQKKGADEVVKIGLKKSMGFTGGLLINVLIVYLVVKVFSFSFDFAYSVFGDSSKEPASREYIIIEIPADSSALDIGKALEDGGVIENKYAFVLKVKLKGYGPMIIPGKYGLSPSMSLQEILNIICRLEEEE
ncbi:MAG: endolytic transglycosylase MltG [Lachnospiraceae bacterium]|nr:endolytic transglycosylase MltG [Lachnospiraceae bacterium]